MYNGLAKRDPRIKHRFVTVFPVDFFRGKHKCRDGVERSVIWYNNWKMGGVIFIPLFEFRVVPRFTVNGKKMSDGHSFCYFTARFIWWQINATFWYSK